VAETTANPSTTPGEETTVQPVQTIRVAQIAGALSAAGDAANGFAPEKGLRTTILAVRLARACGLNDGKVREVFWAAALRFVGCTAFAHETAKVAAGDDNGLRGTLIYAVGGEPIDFLRRLAAGFAPDASLVTKAKAVARLLSDRDGARRHDLARCEAAVLFARDFGMADGVLAALDATGERPDGRGLRKRHGDDMPDIARIADVADLAEVLAWHGGWDAAYPVLEKRAGRGLDAGVVATLRAHAKDMLAGLTTSSSSWETFLASEPLPFAMIDAAEKAERFFTALGRFADVKSVFTLGHSGRVVALVRAAAEAALLSPEARELLVRAAATHDLGRVAVATGIWEKPGPLNPLEWQRVRAHTEQTEHALRMAGFDDIAALASAAHERGAGVGYHRRLPLDVLTPAARLLGAADVCAALGEERPHRKALDDEGIQRTMLELIADGALDKRAVHAVLDALGARAHRHVRRQPWPAGLTEREVEVVRLVAIGRTNKEIGHVLGMSWRTAQKHITNVYDKVGRESRTGLALFALEHGLLEEND
jgi:HD-GYP domain-containing protein (c-di-GMP phosphodiesterase class II)